jgi:2-isopropylmalate synthase
METNPNLNHHAHQHHAHYQDPAFQARRIALYDCTLRDGTQGEGFNLMLEDKIAIAQALDGFGMHYIEGGWPGSNPKDARFFEAMKRVPLRHARLAAFSFTRQSGIRHCEDDPNLRQLTEAETPVITLVAKTWDRHATEALGVSLEENLKMIADTIDYYKALGREVVFDAELAFVGFRHNPRYAREVLATAAGAGADCLVLCDTLGDVMPQEVEALTQEALKFSKNVGIHTHNDLEMAISNALVALRAGANQVQGTVNGVGERTGNMNIITLIGILQGKLGLDCVPELGKLTELSRFVDARANRTPHTHQPLVGASAFAHKGGMHASAVGKDPSLYEHMEPSVVGNSRRVLMSDLAGRSNLVATAAQYGLKLSGKDPAVATAVAKLKALEDAGFTFEGADASVLMLLRQARGEAPYWQTRVFRAHVDGFAGQDSQAEASVQVDVGAVAEHAAALGDGPVNALDRALRKALEPHYPSLREVELLDYKMRVLEGSHGTAAHVRVLIEFGDGHSRWLTVGAGSNSIQASFIALSDGLAFKLMRDGVTPAAHNPAPATTNSAQAEDDELVMSD